MQLNSTMKRLFALILTLIINVHIQAAEDSVCWETISNPVLDINQSQPAEMPIMAIDTVTKSLYIGWHEGDWDGNYYHVKKFDGSTGVWQSLGDKINIREATSNSRVILQLNPIDMQPYVYYYENNGTYDRGSRVKKWNESVWDTIYSDEDFSRDYYMAIDQNGYPLITKKDGDDLLFKKFNGTNDWVNHSRIDKGSDELYDPQIVIDKNNIPYVAYYYSDGYMHSYVRKYESDVWQPLGSLESNTTTRQVACMSMVVDNSDNIVIAYVEQATPNPGDYDPHVFVKRYDGTNWTMIGSEINGDITVNTSGGMESGGTYNQCISLAEDAIGDLYVAWQHETVSGERSIYTQKYDGVSWSEAANPLQDDQKIRAPSLVIDDQGRMNIAVMYDSTPNQTDNDDIKVFRCETSGVFTIEPISDVPQEENSAYIGQTPVITGTPSGSLTYTLSGGDTGAFTIDSSSGVVSMAQMDYENPTDTNTDNVYEVEITATDSEDNSDSESWSITITDVVESSLPTDIRLDHTSVSENEFAGTTVGRFSTIDGEGTYTYSLVAGSGDIDNESFEISGEQLRTNDVFDYESKNLYSIRIKTVDGDGGSYEKAFSITIENDNETPTITIGDQSVSENQSTVVALIGTDPESDTLSWSLTGGADQDKFVINGTDLVFAVAPDFEDPSDTDADNVYVVQVSADDGHSGSVSKMLNITVTDMDETLPPSTNIHASDGSYVDKVSLLIDLVKGAENYKIYRSENNIQPSSEYETVNSTNYDDTYVTSALMYYYWVEACNSFGCSEVSQYDVGHASIQIASDLSSVENLVATDEYYEKVVVSYSESEKAQWYRIYRSDLPSINESYYVGKSPTTSWEDTNRVQGNLNYWVKACNDNGCSDFSAMASGSFSNFSIDTINLQFSVESSLGSLENNHISVFFKFIEGVDHYVLYRSGNGDDFEQADVIRKFYDPSDSGLSHGGHRGTKYIDTDSILNEPYRRYYYWLAGCNASETECKISHSDDGYIKWRESSEFFVNARSMPGVYAKLKFSAYHDIGQLYDHVEIWRTTWENGGPADIQLMTTRTFMDADYDEWEDHTVELSKTYGYSLYYRNSFSDVYAFKGSDWVYVNQLGEVNPDKKALVMVIEGGTNSDRTIMMDTSIISTLSTMSSDRLFPSDMQNMISYIKNGVIAPLKESALSTVIGEAENRLQDVLDAHAQTLKETIVERYQDQISQILEAYPYLPECVSEVLNIFKEQGLSTSFDKNVLLDLYGEEWFGSCLKSIAMPYYDRVFVLTDQDASITGLKNKLVELHREGYQIDILYDNHGCGPDEDHLLNIESGCDKFSLNFYSDKEGYQVKTTKENMLHKIPHGINIGSVYTVSCWGSGFNDVWIELGAKEANGAYQLNWFVLLSPLVFMDEFTRGGKSLEEAAEIGYEIARKLRYGNGHYFVGIDLRPELNTIFPVLEESPYECGVEINGVWFGLDEGVDEVGNKDYCKGEILLVPYKFEKICPPFYSKVNKSGNDSCKIDLLGNVRESAHWEIDLSLIRKDLIDYDGNYAYDSNRPVDKQESSRRINIKQLPFRSKGRIIPPTSASKTPNPDSSKKKKPKTNRFER